MQCICVIDALCNNKLKFMSSKAKKILQEPHLIFAIIRMRPDALLQLIKSKTF